MSASLNSLSPVEVPIFEGVCLRAEALADQLTSESRSALQSEVIAQVERLHRAGLLIAPLPVGLGGVGLGLPRQPHSALLRVLAAVGRGSLALGRLYEGHVNALLLIAHYGTVEQLERAAVDAGAGMLFGVWNTGSPELLQLAPESSGRYTFRGGKTFASGASFVLRPLVTAALPDGGWQMTVVPLDQVHAEVDDSAWQPLGMEESFSGNIDFTGASIGAEWLIGAPGDFYREPLFSGGAIRFTAVQTGGAARLMSDFLEWLRTTKRTEDPYQIARAAEVAIAVEEGFLWIRRAAEMADRHFYSQDLQTLPNQSVATMIRIANMTRTAVEEVCARVMRLVTVGVGARGLLRPHPFEGTIRDLTMYLRQPAPDQTLANVGRAVLREAKAAQEYWPALD